jgi:hypothetical protein
VDAAWAEVLRPVAARPIDMTVVTPPQETNDMHRRWTRTVLAGALAFSLLAAACGDDDEQVQSDAQEAAATGGDADPAGDGSGDSFSGDGSSDFCAMADELEQTDPFDAVGMDMQAAFESMFDVYDDVVKAAPSEIRGDFETVGEGLRLLQGALEDVDYDFTQLDDEAMEEILENARFEEAGERIERYLEEVCGIDSGEDLDMETPMTLPGDLESAEGVSQMLAQMLGITEEQAACLAEEIGGIDPENPDISRMMGSFGDCGIDPTQLGRG